MSINHHPYIKESDRKAQMRKNKKADSLDPRCPYCSEPMEMVSYSATLRAGLYDCFCCSGSMMTNDSNREERKRSQK
jgi:uncharacterized protein with PIN domain